MSKDKNGRYQCCSRCGPRFMKFDGVKLHIPYEKSWYFWSNSQFKVSIEVVPIITPHFIATCLNLLFWHKSCLSSWTHHMQFEVFVHFSISFLGCFLDLLGPSDLSSRARANTTFFFHGDIWKLWALLNVKVTASVLALLYKYLGWPPKSMQGPVRNSLFVFVGCLSGFFVSLPPFVHSIIQQKVRVPGPKS